MKGILKFLDIIDIDEIKKVAINIEEEKIYTSFITDADTALGQIVLYENPFNIHGHRIAISELGILKSMFYLYKNPKITLEFNKNNLNDEEPKLIRIEEGDITSKFMLSYSKNIRIPKKKEVDKYDVHIDFDDEKIEKFKKFSRILSKNHDYFTFETTDGKLSMMFGEHSDGKFLAYNSINYNLNVETDKQFQNKFDTKLFSNIIRKNQDAKILISLEENLVRIKCKKEGEYLAIYYLNKII